MLRQVWKNFFNHPTVLSHAANTADNKWELPSVKRMCAKRWKSAASMSILMQSIKILRSYRLQPFDNSLSAVCCDLPNLTSDKEIALALFVLKDIYIQYSCSTMIVSSIC